MLSRAQAEGVHEVSLTVSHDSQRGSVAPARLLPDTDGPATCEVAGAAFDATHPADREAVDERYAGETLHIPSGTSVLPAGIERAEMVIADAEDDCYRLTLRLIPTTPRNS